MLEDIARLIKPCISYDQTLLIAVSGGPDSFCLLDIMNRLGFHLVVAHFNHQLRDGAKNDQLYVQNRAAEMKIRFVNGSSNVRKYASDNRLSVEEAGRQLRYEFLFSKAREISAAAVLVGHTSNDQVETILMHIIRGTGLSGLKGMPICSLPNLWSDDISLIRPLILTKREFILDYCQRHALNPIIDSSNEETVFFRNKLRHELIPQLEDYNPRFGQRLIKMADIIREDDRELAEITDEAWVKCINIQSPTHIGFSKKKFQEQSRSIKRRLVIKIIQSLASNYRDLGFDMINRVLTFMDYPSKSSQADIGAGLSILIESDMVYIFLEKANLPTNYWPQLPTIDPVELKYSGKLHLNSGWSIEIKKINQEDLNAIDHLYQYDQNRIFIDIPGETDCLYVRPRNPGDRISPMGMHGQSMKVSKIMINEKIPVRARRLWPLLFYDDELIWIPGLRISEKRKLTDELINPHEILLKNTSKVNNVENKLGLKT